MVFQASRGPENSKMNTAELQVTIRVFCLFGGLLALTFGTGETECPRVPTY